MEKQTTPDLSQFPNPPRFDKAWQRRQYHAPEVEAMERKVYDSEQLRRKWHSKRQDEAVYQEMVKKVLKARKRAGHQPPEPISYAEAADILGVQPITIAALHATGKIAGRPDRLSRSSVEAYRDTRKGKGNDETT